MYRPYTLFVTVFHLEEQSNILGNMLILFLKESYRKCQKSIYQIYSSLFNPLHLFYSVPKSNVKITSCHSNLTVTSSLQEVTVPVQGIVQLQFEAVEQKEDFSTKYGDIKYSEHCKLV